MILFYQVLNVILFITMTAGIFISSITQKEEALQKLFGSSKNYLTILFCASVPVALSYLIAIIVSILICLFLACLGV